MASKKNKRGRKPTETLEGYTHRFAEWLAVKNYSEKTVIDRRQALLRFTDWCRDRGINRPVEVTQAILDMYQRYLFHYRKVDGNPLGTRSQINYLAALRVFFRWLARSHFILYNPAADLELPRQEKRLPSSVFTTDEIEAVLAVTNLDKPNGLRDRAMLETLYSSGIRRMELINLELYDVDRSRGTLMVRQGKGKKDRVVPIGDRALKWIEKYLAESRPLLSNEMGDGPLFVTKTGRPFHTSTLTHLVTQYIKKAELGKIGSCHWFRHSMATAMLEGGAGLRYLQAMLGHGDLSSTQVYTHVSIAQLKEVHRETHPAKMKGVTEEKDDTSDSK